MMSQLLCHLTLPSPILIRSTGLEQPVDMEMPKKIAGFYPLMTSFGAAKKINIMQNCEVLNKNQTNVILTEEKIFLSVSGQQVDKHDRVAT